MFSRWYDRVLAWSAHRHAQRYLVGLAVAEATVFPVPPDVMLAPMVLARRERAWWLAALTTLASVAGGLIGYVIGLFALELVLPWIERVGYLDAYTHAVGAFQRYGLWFVIVVGFTPIPYKLITIAAGAMGMPLVGFLFGSLIGRGARFFLVSGLIYAGGVNAAENLRGWVDRIGWAVVTLAIAAAIGVWLWP